MSTLFGTPLRVIHVGVGGRGRWPLEVLGADPRFQSVALVDVMPANLAAAREATGLAEDACFSSVEAALAAVEADALVVCTPTKTHAAMCRAGFAAGKHVLVEKGMTLDWAEANALVEEAERAGVAFCVSQNYRYMAETRTLKQVLDAGTYGRPHLIDVICHRYRPEPRTLDYPFAMVWDMGCHHFDNLVSLFGPVARVTAVTHNAPWSAYAYDAGVTAVLELAAGQVCNYVLTHQATTSLYRHLVQTEQGVLSFGERLSGASGEGGRQWTFTPKPDRQLGRPGPAEPIPSVEVPRSEQGVVDDWYRFIKEGAEPGISGRNNLETLAVCEMIVRASTERRPVTRDDLAPPSS